MPFNTIRNLNKAPSGIGAEEVEVRKKDFTRGEVNFPSLAIRIGADLAKEAMLKSCDRVDVKVGTGPDACELAVVSNPEGAFKCRELRTGVCVVNVGSYATADHFHPPEEPLMGEDPIVTARANEAPMITFGLPETFFKD